jgi:hypothetical protein
MGAEGKPTNPTDEDVKVAARSQNPNATWINPISN